MIDKILRPYKYLELRIIKDNYKFTSFKAKIPQTSTTSSQASKDKAYKSTSFKGQVHKLQRTSSQLHQAHKLQRYNPKNFKDQAHKPQC
jgi:hypothetical protein